MKRQAHTVSVQRYEASNMGPSRCRYLGPDPLAINSQPNNQSRVIRQTPSTRVFTNGFHQRALPDSRVTSDGGGVSE